MAYWRLMRRRRKFYTKWTGASRNIMTSRMIVRLTKLAFIGVIFVFLGSFVVLPLLALGLPTPDKVVRHEGFSTKILDRNGKALYEIYNDQNRNPIQIKDIPDYLKQATVAIEDKNFYQHQGFDPLGILRGFSRLFTRGSAQGGSTLTQQLVKNVLLTSERTIWRKVKEFLLAIQIERMYSKDEILQMYLNEAPYGGTSWGVGTAAEIYFGKEVKDLNLIESAILAGLPQRPSYYSPYSSSPKAYVDRTKQVLRRMREDGYITSDQEEEVLDQMSDIQFQEKGANFKAPHFVQYVQRILEDRYGEAAVEAGGLKVTTTLDLDLHDKAQEVIAEEIDKVKNLHITNGAAVVMNPDTGEILAMIGSRGFNDPDIDGQVNVTLSLRQPGSSIKPITYVTAFKKGYTPASLLIDTPTEFPAGTDQPMYKPVNYDGKFRGPIQVRYALANSVNIPAVKMLARVGIRDMVATAYDLGITSLEPTAQTLSRVGLSVTLGGGEVRLLELTNAYGAFVNGGFRIDPIAILKVEDLSGKVLESVEPKKGRSVLTPEQAYLIADILSDNEARKEVFGLNSQLNIPNTQVAVKTGTTNDKRDNWTIGGNKNTLVGVWVGNNDNSPMLSVASGVTGASPIWRKILLEAIKGKPNTTFEAPGGIVTASVDIVSGYSAHDGFPSRLEKFIVGTQPSNNDLVHAKLKVCKNDGKLASPSDISSNNFEEKEFIVLKEDDPVSTDGQNRWQVGIDSWIIGQSDARYHPPTDYCGANSPVNVEFTAPHDHDSNLPNKFSVKAQAESTSDVTELELEVDGVKVATFNKSPLQHDVNLGSGVHTLRVKAKDSNGRESDRRITIGVGVNWDYATPTPTVIPTPVLSPTSAITP
jgi:1A family penicillin-binding protein